ncbi:glycoside hydrolase family 95 protein [Pedobacter nyackensis]|uniref:glycoside hydrolase family 95 protein n=1 Tax=Pedobacter nyackensis TaxID=475255 RepID=UPI00292CD0E5|nr:glycoside hydrolase family 95 protein [Pedobacter nyackensis]
MISFRLLVTICIASISNYSFAQSNNHVKLWYNEPANASIKDNPNGWVSDAEWLKALPLGNGFLGAMVFGDVNKERIQLNEKSLWSGSQQESDNPEAHKSLAQIRDLLFAGKYKEATELTNKTQICVNKGSGQGSGANVPFGCFQTLGDLWLDFETKAPYSGYYRELDLINGIALTKYEQNGVKYQREVFISNPDKALIVRLTASKPNALSFNLAINRPEKFTTVAENNKLVMSGSMTDGKGGEGMKYKAYATPVVTGGSVRTTGNSIRITKATSVTIVVTAATDYRLHYPDYINNNFENELNEITKKAVAEQYTRLRDRHVKDFSSFMRRSDLVLGNGFNTDIPTNELLDKNVKTKNESALYTLYYQYGRYLLLSSSRAGSLPANLQGIWANQIQTPWNGDYHTDINVQMNYWPAEVTNLSETSGPLFDLISSLQEPGKKTAKIQYNTTGWVLHPITNVWGYTSPGEHPSWGMHVGAGAWICLNLWEHYAFTNNKSYLSQLYPILKSSSIFYLNWLVKDKETGKLVSGPSPSPENSFVAPDGSRAQISMGPSHDQQVIFDLFTNTLKSAQILNIQDAAFLNKLKDALGNLARPEIGSDGRLMEWAKEFKEVEPQHRHLSHLFAVYPGNEITLEQTPELAEAAKKSLSARGDGGVGWSFAWKIALWARMGDGDRAFSILNDQLKPTMSRDTKYDGGGGTYYNLFDACPPFQIDGNFGVIAGMAEMFLQSHQGFITLLPALPKAWKDGEIKGMVARGGFVIDIKWKDGKITSASLLAKSGGSCQLRYGVKKVDLKTVPGKRYDLTKNLL